MLELAVRDSTQVNDTVTSASAEFRLFSSCVNGGVVDKATSVDSGSGRRTSVVTKTATEWC